MARRRLSNPSQPLLVRCVLSLYEFLASLKLAVVLILGLAVVLGVATFVESNLGAPGVRFYVYHTRWFALFLAMLGVNIFCAAAIRYPWKRYQTGFVITHIGLLTLLAGSAISFRSSLNSQMLVFMDDASEFAIDDDYGFLVFENLPNRAEPLRVSFQPGPFNWDDRAPYPIIRKLKSWVGSDDLSRPWQHPPQVLHDDGTTKIEVVDFYSRSETRRLPYLDLMFENPGVGAELPIQLEYSETSIGDYVAGFARQDFAGIGEVLMWRAVEADDLTRFRECIPQTAVQGQGAVVVWQDGEVFQASVNRLEALQADGKSFQLDKGCRLELVTFRASQVMPPTADVLENYPWKTRERRERGLIVMGPRIVLKLTLANGETQEITRLSAAPFFAPEDLPDGWRVELYHPEMKGRVDILESPAGSLACRVWQQKTARVVNNLELKPGEPVPTWSTGGGQRVWNMLLRRHQPLDRDLDPREDVRRSPVQQFDPDAQPTVSVRQRTTRSWSAPLPLPFDKDDRSGSQRVKIQLSWQDGQEKRSDRFWLAQSQPPPWSMHGHELAHDTDIGSGKPVNSAYRVRESQVGFTMKLVDFDLDVDPGTQMPSNYTSHLVQIDVRNERNEKMLDAEGNPIDIPQLRKEFAGSEGVDREKLRQKLSEQTAKLTNAHLEKLEGATAGQWQELVDASDSLQTHVITMNAPLDYPDWNGRNLRFFQESYLAPGKFGRPELGSIFRVNYDPGRPVKYLGSALIVFGIFMMFYMRAYFFKRVKGSQVSRTDQLSSEPAVADRPQQLVAKSSN